MKIEVVEVSGFTAVGIRVTDYMSNLGIGVRDAWIRLQDRKQEIKNIKDSSITLGISPPNYKGNNGMLDFYVCFGVEPFVHLPQGMVHIEISPRLYVQTSYKGSGAESYKAYDFTTQWIKEHGYSYDDISYYFEVYNQRTKMLDPNDTDNEIQIFCPVKPMRFSVG